MARKKQAKKTRAAGRARPAAARKTTRKATKKAVKKTARKTAKKVAKKTARTTVKKTVGPSRKSSSAKAATEASVSVRQRAFRGTEVEEQAELPLEAGLPPGVSGEEPPRATAGMERARGKHNDRTVNAIERTAENIYGRILKGDKPELKSPVRSLGNVTYKKAVGYFEIGRQKKVRTLTVNTVRTFAQSLRMMSLSKEMVHADTFATKRDAYYQSKNWEDARFNDQTESDTVMDDIEAMFSLEGVTREQLRFYPEEHGGAVAGELVVVDRDPVTGGVVEIDCTRFGSGAYTIPHSVEHLKFKTKAKFVLAIETGGMFQRLQYHAYPSKAKCIIISMGGVPTRACRRFIRRLSDEARIPVYAFVDCDPYGISNIYRSLKVGSGNAAHINKFFCVPKARFLGVTPDDIIKYKLPTHPLKDVDVSRAKDALKNDPFFHAHKPWSKALQQLLKMGVRAEQQALAKWGLNYVMDEYLPAKLKDTRNFLP
jgi:DNA topoisomerase-6 subunit A